MIKFLKLSTPLLSAILLLSPAFAQTDKIRIESYINTYKELAIAEMLRTGVPASITLAQGILETAGGQSDLAEMANNHFGIKCKSEWTGETMLHDDDAKNECFRKYPSVEELFKDHSDFLRSRPMYAFLFKLDPTDFEGWAKGLKKAGYATNGTYAQQLIKLIIENNLQSYSLIAMQRKEGGDDLILTASAGQKTPASEYTKEEVAAIDKNLAEVVIPKNNKGNSGSASYPFNSIFNINEARVIYVAAGTSLLAVANNYSVGLKKLLEFNDLEHTDILSTDQLIYLEKKSKKGTRKIHIVEKNESVHDIAQKEGIQLSSILEYNGLQKGMQPAPGEKIYLKFPAPFSPKLAVASPYKAGNEM